MADSFERFTERARLALQYAQEEATRMEHNHIGTEHLLLGLIRVGDGVSGHVLRQLGFELEKVRKSVEFIIGRGHTRFAPSLGLTPRAKKVLELAVVEAQQLRHPHIGTEHLLLGIIREGQGVAVGVIESFGVSLDSIRSALGEILGPPSTAESFESSLQPVVARDREIERLLNVLLRRTRHHPIVVGGVGAGRNSVVRGLVQRMATVELPIRLQFRRVLRMQAAEDLEKIDATFREARLGNNAVVASALERFSAEAVALLTSQLANDAFRVIGITTPLGFEAIAAEHPTFAEHVQPVLVEELPEAEAVSVLRLMVAPLEEHHSVTFGEDALTTAVELARRYQPDRLLPGSAVELLDDAARRFADGLSRQRMRRTPTRRHTSTYAGGRGRSRDSRTTPNNILTNDRRQTRGDARQPKRATGIRITRRPHAPVRPESRRRSVWYIVGIG